MGDQDTGSPGRPLSSGLQVAGEPEHCRARTMLLKSRASPDMLPFSLCNKKRLAIPPHEQTPLSNDTIDSVIRHREVSRAKDLSVPPHMSLKGTTDGYRQ